MDIIIKIIIRIGLVGQPNEVQRRGQKGKTSFSSDWKRHSISKQKNWKDYFRFIGHEMDIIIKIIPLIIFYRRNILRLKVKAIKMLFEINKFFDIKWLIN